MKVADASPLFSRQYLVLWSTMEYSVASRCTEMIQVVKVYVKYEDSQYCTLDILAKPKKKK